MNKSHITDGQVDRAITEWSSATRISIDELSWEDAEGVRRNMRRALESAFPEQQPAKPWELPGYSWNEESGGWEPYHSIKPIAFADQDPPNGYSYWGFEIHGEVTAYYLYHEYDCKSAKAATYWLPASALPIPDPAAVDAKEAAWKEYCSDWRSVGVKANRLDFLAGYEAGQAGGAK